MQAFADEEDDQFKLKGGKDAEKETETKLYGRWQTEEYVPPRAENGIVPKNERGNVVCPPLAFCLPTVRACPPWAHVMSCWLHPAPRRRLGVMPPLRL